MSQISAIEVHLLDLPLTEPFVAGHGTTNERTIVAISVTTDSGVGWGECSALPAATYTAESATGAFNALADHLAPRLIGTAATGAEVRSHLTDFESQPMAIAGLEMAVLDAELKTAGRSLADWLGATAATVPAGVSIGLDTVDATVAKAAALFDDGYRRLKVKIQPDDAGDDHRLVAALRAAIPDAELQLDANGTYAADAIERLLAFVELGAATLEQPFAVADRAAAVELVRRVEGSGVAVVADEAVSSVAEAEALLAERAMTGLSIKPGRVGGLTVARILHDLCVTNDVAATAGGMLETGLGRHALASMAAMAGFTLTGDLSPAGRWLAADPWPDVEFIDGEITVPTAPGVAPQPDPYLLDRYRLERRRID